MPVERVYNKAEVEGILLREKMRPLPGDVMEYKGRQAIVLEYKGIQEIGMNANAFAYDVCLQYIVLVGLRKQKITKNVVVSEELLRAKEKII